MVECAKCGEPIEYPQIAWEYRYKHYHTHCPPENEVKKCRVCGIEMRKVNGGWTCHTGWCQITEIPDSLVEANNHS